MDRLVRINYVRRDNLFDYRFSSGAFILNFAPELKLTKYLYDRRQSLSLPACLDCLAAIDPRNMFFQYRGLGSQRRSHLRHAFRQLKHTSSYLEHT